MSARVAVALGVVASAACTASPPPAPRAVVALARTTDGTSSAASELASGIAIEVGHWLARSPDVVVRTPSLASARSISSFTEAGERLGTDLVVWVDVVGTHTQPVVRYSTESANSQERRAQELSATDNDLVSVPRHIAADVLGSTLSPWPPLSPATYAKFLRTIGREPSALADVPLPRDLEHYPPALTELGRTYLDLAGRSSGSEPYYDRAEHILRRAVQLDAAYPPARQLLASYFAKHGQSEQSVTLLQEGLSTHPNYPGYYDQLGYVLRYAGLMEPSMENYRRAQALDRSLENLVSAQDQITKSLIYLGRYQDAMSSHVRMESFMNRAGSAPDEKEWFYKGVIHLYADERDQAVEAFRRGEALDGTSVWTTFGRGYAGIANGNRDQVAKVLDALERLVVVDGERHYRLVHFACFLGEHDRALEHLATSIRGGFFNAPYIAADPLTTALRSQPRFAQLLREAEERHIAFHALVTKD
jgi:tetratricopeptide (TPR) repeat protein